MRYLTFGSGSGLRMSELVLGTGNFGTAWGGGADPATSRAVLEHYAEAGGLVVDTADMYQDGESETLLGELLGRDRDEFVLCTKYGYGVRPTGSVSLTGNHRKAMVAGVEASLRRLRTDHVDVLWAHAPDGLTPVREVVKGFEDLISAGKVRYGGLSNFPAWRTVQAVDLADRHGWSVPVGIQVAYSLAERSADREQLPMARELGLGVAAWSPLGGGLLTGKYRTGTAGRLRDWGGRVVPTEDTAQRRAVVDAVLEEGAALGVAPHVLALAWLRHRAGASGAALVPVIGPRDVAQLDDALRALDLDPPQETLRRLDEISAPGLGAPHQGNLRQGPALRGRADDAWLTPPPR